MKNILATLFLVLVLGLSASAQTLFDFKIDIETEVRNGQTFGNITVQLKDHNESVKYQLLPAGDFNAQALYESRSTKKDTYTFKNIPEGKYYIKLINAEGHFAFQLIEVKKD